MDPAMGGAAPPPEGGGLDEASIRQIIQEELAGAGGGGEAKPKKAKPEDLAGEMKSMKLMLAKVLDLMDIPISATEAFGGEEEAAPETGEAAGPAGAQGQEGEAAEAPGPTGDIEPVDPIAAGLKTSSLLDDNLQTARAAGHLLRVG
jgi:hypothetical protein